jgi:hypothetical protein
MSSPQPTTADWLRLFNRTRLVQLSQRNVATSADPFAKPVQSYASNHWSALKQFGIHRVFLQTRDSRSSRYYDLSVVGGHVAKLGRPPVTGNHRVSVSRSHYVTEDAMTPTDGFRLQVIIHHDDIDRSHDEAIALYSNTLASEFLMIIRNIYFRNIEIGATEIGRLRSSYNIEKIRPGTYAVGLVKRLSRAISARVAIYCIILHDIPHIEYICVDLPIGYFRRAELRSSEAGWRKSVKLLKGAALPGAPVGEMSTYTDRMARKEHIVIDGQSQLFGAFEKYSALFCPIDLVVESLVLAPVNYEGQVIGCFAFLFGSESPGYSSSARSLVSRALDDFSTPAKYLFQRRSHQMVVDPIFKSRDTRITPDTCFVVMPFSESWSDAVFSALRSILIEERLIPVRADDLFGENVVEDMWAAILKSSFIIADVTGRNPNVYYELGIAHTLGKKVILLSQNVEDIPFDTRHLRHVVYTNTLAGVESIRKGVRGFLSSR